MWHILSFPMHGRSHSVQRLAIHLEQLHNLVVNHRDPELADQLDKLSKTMLTEYFKLNQSDRFAQGLYYSEIPLHYTWKEEDRC